MNEERKKTPSRRMTLDPSNADLFVVSMPLTPCRKVRQKKEVTEMPPENQYPAQLGAGG